MSKCRYCGHEISQDELDRKAKQKSDRIKTARTEAKSRGEQVGATLRFTDGVLSSISSYVGAGFTWRRTAEIHGCSTSIVAKALKVYPLKKESK